MSGHNKWSKIKHQKAKTDAARGKAFSKSAMDIITAVRTGGSDDPEKSATLRVAIDAAKKINMPNDNIKRAIERGAGLGDSARIENIFYEGYGPNGVALYIECMTDNRNRTASDVRSTLEKNGGSLGEPGTVAYLFHKKGYLEFDTEVVSEEKLMESLIEAGAEDIINNDDISFSVYCDANNLHQCIAAAEAANIPMAKAELTMQPATTVSLDEENVRKVLALIDKLDDVNDVKNISANIDISDEIMKKLSE
ncbi:YebC/PmpR family DNA-binding transcriptional regulator [bacterium]|nr:YebC/PmpR family DNA-binding transcriptional regulator [bacterium]